MTHDSPDQAEPQLSLAGTPLPDFAEPIRTPHGTSPRRLPQSVRRTMSIDVHWPEGFDGPGHYLGRCRDALTRDPDESPECLREAEIAVVAREREIVAITANPAPARLPELVGLRAGSHLRVALAERLAEDKAQGTPLYLLLDDLAGATFVSNWALTQWDPDWLARYDAMPQRPVMAGVCIGFRPGASSLDAEGVPVPQTNSSPVVALVNPADPAGWHDLPDLPGMAFRRARRIDAWAEGAGTAFDAMFQDSATTPAGGDRMAIHEYRLSGRIDAEGRLLAIDAVPGTLPHAPCRAAPVNLTALLGEPVQGFRELVPERLRRTAGCTHLNDALRALAELEPLAAALPR